jgi:hypothetical protein
MASQSDEVFSWLPNQNRKYERSTSNTSGNTRTNAMSTCLVWAGAREKMILLDSV